MKKKSVPTNKSLYSKIKREVKADYDVWPSAYASGALTKRYKAAGGKYRTVAVKKSGGKRRGKA